MLKLNLNRIFKVKGISKPNQFLISAGNSIAYATTLVNDRSVSIRFDKLEVLCKSLNCTPNDLFDFVDTGANPLPDSHALHSISKSDKIEIVGKLLNDLPMERIEELYRELAENRDKENGKK